MAGWIRWKLLRQTDYYSVVEAMDISDDRVRDVIGKLTKAYADNPDKWKTEREIHYEFFRLLFDEFEPEEIKESFRWEYPAVFRREGERDALAAIDLIFRSSHDKWVAIEIEYVDPGRQLRKELEDCISKLKDTDECKMSMERGYIVPFLARQAEKTARGYDVSYEELCRETVKDADSNIGDSPIEIITDGIILT